MTINLFANVLNNEAIDNLTPAQADAVLAIFDKPTVDIVAVEPQAIRDRADTLRPGDIVFDTTGGTHGLVRVTNFKRTTRTLRADGVTDYFERDEIVTRIPKEVTA